MDCRPKKSFAIRKKNAIFLQSFYGLQHFGNRLGLQVLNSQLIGIVIFDSQSIGIANFILQLVFAINWDWKF